MGWLTTHVLDTARGQPAEGMAVTLWRIGDENGDAMTPVQIAETVTNKDGRTDDPIMPKEDFALGIYLMTFSAGDWLRGEGLEAPEPFFLDTIPIRFGISEDSHYHVPLLLSPFGYSTYRGS